MTSLPLSHDRLNTPFYIIEVPEIAVSQKRKVSFEFLSQHIGKTFQSLQREVSFLVKTNKGLVAVLQLG